MVGPPVVAGLSRRLSEGKAADQVTSVTPDPLIFPIVSVHVNVTEEGPRDRFSHARHIDLPRHRLNLDVGGCARRFPISFPLR